jgi:hypothetical protein
MKTKTEYERLYAQIDDQAEQIIRLMREVSARRQERDTAEKQLDKIRKALT